MKKLLFIVWILVASIDEGSGCKNCNKKGTPTTPATPEVISTPNQCGGVRQGSSCTRLGGKCVDITTACCGGRGNIFETGRCPGNNNIKCCLSSNSYNAGTSKTIDGIDVSHFQEEIDWSKVAKSSSVKFAIMKASEGATWTDKTFLYNWKEAKKNGLRVGAYHFFRDTVSVSNQVRNFVNQIRKVAFNPAKDILVIDIESGNKSRDKRTKMLWQMLQEVKKKLKAEPIIYTGYSFWKDQINWRKYNFTQYRLWLARYSRTPQNTPGNFSSWYIWQYSEKGWVPGLKNNRKVDLNKMRV